MSNDRITVNYGLTKNLGDYNSLKLEARIETDVAEGETLDQAYERGWAVVDSQIAKQLDEWS